jgi:hypothetical protein
MALVDVDCVLEGVTYLLCNRFSDAAAESASSGTRGVGIKDKGTAREQAEHKLYIGHDGKPMIPQPNLFRCVIDAGKFFKAGKSKVTTQKNSLIPACLEVHGIEIRILCHRPCFHDWRLAFAMTLDTDLIPVKLLREILDAAGRRIGLGDFRPDCKGPFGKFSVVQWAARKQGEENGSVRRDAVGVA